MAGLAVHEGGELAHHVAAATAAAAHCEHLQGYVAHKEYVSKETHVSSRLQAHKQTCSNIAAGSSFFFFFFFLSFFFFFFLSDSSDEEEEEEDEEEEEELDVDLRRRS